MTANDPTQLEEQVPVRGSGDASPATELPEPPRPLTGRARRGSWTEPRVRLWWLMAAAVAATGLALLATRYLQWRSDTRLVREGMIVQAFIWASDGFPVPGRNRPPSSQVTLRYNVGGRDYEVVGYLEGRKEFYVTHTHVPIRVDPDEPSRWTARADPDPLWFRLLGGMMLLPAAVIFALVALLKRASMLRLWRNGRLVETVVIDSRHTALAPRSRFVRCAAIDPQDKLVRGVHVPRRAADVVPGDAVWLVADPRGGSRAVAVSWMQ